jgi:hypothetical protein
MAANETIMPNKKIDPLPNSFSSEEEAGEFWDTHSLSDYEEFLEPVDLTFDLKERIYEVRVEEDVYKKLRQEAETSHKPVPKIVDQILRKELPLTK